MHVDFKISIWERIEIPPEKENEVREKIKSGEISTGSQLMDVIGADSDGAETLYDTGEQLTPKDNGGNSTVEIWEDESLDPNRNPMKCTWQNGTV